MVFMPPGRPSPHTPLTYSQRGSWRSAGPPGASQPANTADLAKSFSRRVRGRIREHSKLLGIGLAREAEDNWGTTNGGEYNRPRAWRQSYLASARTLASSTTRVSRQDGAAARPRSTVWDWYWGDFYNRLKPGARQVIVMTRWAEATWAGGWKRPRATSGRSSACQPSPRRTTRSAARRASSCGAMTITASAPSCATLSLATPSRPDA
jgi:hypothetical protein